MRDGVSAEVFAWNKLVQGRHGTFLASPNDTWLGESMLAYGEWSEGEVQLFRRLLKPSDVAIEVGANAGYHTVPLARMLGMGGSVIAVEPQRLVFQTLCANIILNGLRNVRTIHAACGSGPGVIEVPQLDPTEKQPMGGLSLVDGTPGALLRSESPLEFVHVVTVDILEASEDGSIGLLKADVEGMEPQVIVGARQMIERHQPAIYVEADREASTPALYDALSGLGYAGWWHFPPLHNPDNFARLVPGLRTFRDVVSMNMLWLPADRVEEGDALLPGQAVMGEETWGQAARRLKLYKEPRA